MVNVLAFIGFVVNFAALFFLIMAFYYILQIRLYTKGFREVWNYVLFGIICLIIIIAMSLFLTLKWGANLSLGNLTNTLAFILASFFFYYGFLRLYRVFSEISYKKIFPHIRNVKAYKKK